MVIRGARQVGKTSLVRAFATAHTGRFAELNLEQPAHAALFRRGLSLNETIQSILLECRVPAAREPLLLFLDEIQAVPEAVALLRFFHEERPDIRVIAAGVIPVEAKSGAEGKLRSLHQYVRLGGAQPAVRLYAGPPACHDVGLEGVAYRLINIPYYAATMIPRYLASSASNSIHPTRHKQSHDRKAKTTGLQRIFGARGVFNNE